MRYKWHKWYWAQMISIPRCRHVCDFLQTNQLPEVTFTSATNILLDLWDEQSVQELWSRTIFFHEAAAYETCRGLHRKTESDKLQPYCSAFTMFHLCQAPRIHDEFLFQKKEKEKEINLLRPEGCAHQLLELMKNTLELWVRKSWLLISEG